MINPLYALPSSPTRVDDAIDHTGVVPKLVTPFPSSQQHCPPRARDVVHPTPCRSHDTVESRRPRVRSTVILPEPATPQSPRHRWTHTVPEPATPSSSPNLQGYNIVYFSLSFWAYKSWFWYATLSHCFDMYIAFILLHCFGVMHCHIALICYIAFNMSHYFDMLHCHIALICYNTFDMLHCHIALICYIDFVLLHCFDMLHCHIALICYTLLQCFCSATFWSIWMHITLLNDESGLSEMHVATWINIIVLSRFQLRTTCSK
jgi:hypothetical protein